MTFRAGNTNPHAAVLHFWFTEISPKEWFRKSDRFDEIIRDRFGALHDEATRCELWHWRVDGPGRLAEVILLDQFSRNLYRGSARAFVCDGLALALAQEAVSGGFDRQLPLSQRMFFYMPYMHSESLVIHEQAVELFSQPGLETSLAHEYRHRAVLERFGRYPQRNRALGRDTTDAEAAFLLQPGTGF